MTKIEQLAHLEALAGERLAFWVGRELGELKAGLPGDLAWIANRARHLGFDEDVIELGMRNLTQSLTVAVPGLGSKRRVFPA